MDYLYNIEDINKRVQKYITGERYFHSLGVSFTAAALAMRHGGDIISAQVAGLLHDCAKDLNLEKMQERCEKMNESVSSLERENVSLLHSKAGAATALRDFHIDDADILNAIRYHTTGRQNMSLLEKIIYTADFIEPDRGSDAQLNQIRKAVFADLDKGLMMILNNTVEKLKTGKKQIDPKTLAAYEFYVSQATAL